MHEIIRLQKSDGSWVWDQRLLNILGTSIASEKRDAIVATALAIAFLQNRMAHEAASWELIVEKARSWLSQQPGVDAEKEITSLAKANLVPGSAAGLITEGFRPTTKLNVRFGEKVVELGTFLRAGECKQAPTIAFVSEADAPENASYSFILTDPDAPTPDDPKFAFWRHWVLSGLRPSGVDAATTSSELTAYLGPGPKDDSKPHRYLFLLYREPEGLNLSKDDVGGEEFVQRRSFKPAEFVERHSLRLVGVNWMAGIRSTDDNEHDEHRRRHIGEGIKETLSRIMMLVQPDFITRDTKESARKTAKERDRRDAETALLYAIVLTDLEDSIWRRTATRKLTTEQARRHAAGVHVIESHILGLLMDYEKKCRRMW
ncbi:hypothetical protein NUW58_g3247 [Xylaria curta]|uniref:Uncharacterized protein n=1 Tax=Xylaria curta TaxID=42375 RepID=A0ACC1PCE2_9PEZI|nr:hypothetical protein NUW58_g3247 [Xylaria curta]